MNKIELNSAREVHTVLPGRAIDLGPKPSATIYIIISGRSASVSKKPIEGKALENPQDIPPGETFKVGEGETVRLYNHWGKTPILCHALNLKTK